MEENLDKYHLKNDKGKITGVFDNAIYKDIVENNAIFVLGGFPYIYSAGAYKPDLKQGAILKTMIRGHVIPQFIKAPTIKRIYDLFLCAAELQTDLEDVNKYPEHWINFKNGFYDPIERKMHEHDPKYKAINQLQVQYNPAEKVPGDAVEEWLHFIFENDADREMMLQYFGYCMTRDTRQQKFMVLCGEGGTGKSTLIHLLETIIGPSNTCNVSLSELAKNQFASIGLLGKLLNSCADLEITALEDTSRLKKLLGEDAMRGEAKGKDAISFRNYAKLIFSANELPIVTAERTNGFYRRLLVLSMNKTPNRKNADLFKQLKNELPYFVHLCVDALSRMHEVGYIAESKNSKDAVERLRMDSDTVEAFIIDEAKRMPGKRESRAVLVNHYETYCQDTERKPLSKNGFYRAMRSKGFTEIKSNGEWYFQGIILSENCPESTDPSGCTIVDEPLPFL